MSTRTQVHSVIKIHEDARKKLKLLAALLDMTMIDALDLVIEEGLKAARNAPGSVGNAAPADTGATEGST